MILIFKYDFDINEFYEINISEDRTSLKAKRRLPEALASYNTELVKFLLLLNANPALTSISLSISPYNYSDEYNKIPKDFDIRNEDYEQLNISFDVVEKSTLSSALQCKDSTSFYLLVNSGKLISEEDTQLILRGAFKWGDKSLLSQLLQDGARISFVPETNDLEVLKMLILYTDGIVFGQLVEVEFGARASDLMDAVSDGKKDMVWFMLETGAEPNECLPNPFKPGNETGMQPAITALSIAQDSYNENNDKYEELKGVNSVATQYKEKAMVFSEIIDLLKKYGAKEVKWCSSAP